MAELMHRAATRPSGSDPWHWPREPQAEIPRQVPSGPATAKPRKALPLELRGPKGAIAFKERGLFDDKLALQTEFKYDGNKGGAPWKGKLERYFISRAPILKDILEWAEGQDLEIVTEAKFQEAVGLKLDEEQVLTVNAAMWGFLSTALSGAAEVIFKGAEPLNGLDAWRRIVRYIDHGKEIRLGELRDDVKRAHIKPMRELDEVETGIAAFDNLLREYHDAGGTEFKDAEKKSDLLRILPEKIREHLIWHSTDDLISYEKFRGMILHQTGKIMQTRKRMPVHAVQDEPVQDIQRSRRVDERYEDEELNVADFDDLEDYIAAVRAQAARGRFPLRRSGDRRPAGSRPRAPAVRDAPGRKRRCANCSQEHEGRCTTPLVDKALRVCWDCNKKGHNAAQCPDRKPGRTGGLRAIEDAKLGAALSACFMLEDGFKRVDRKKAARPMPQQATLHSFISQNFFDELDERDRNLNDADQGVHGAIGVRADETAVETPGRSTATSPSTSSSRAPTRSMRASQGMQEDTRRGADRRQSGPGAGSPSDRPQRTSATSRPSSSPTPTSPSASSMGPFDGGTLDTKHPIDGPSPVYGAHEVPAGDHPSSLDTVKEMLDPDQVARISQEKLEAIVQVALREAEMEMIKEDEGFTGVIEYSEDNFIQSVAEKVKVKVAMDSGAVANVIHPKHLPPDATPEPNTTGKHFNGAGGDFIERFGTCMTELEGEHGSVGCDWDLADVSRALHSVSKVAGPYEGPGKQDIVFNNKRCVVVPPGVLDAIMKHVKAVAEYKREGNLYVAEMTMSSFQRQEPKA